MLASVANGSVDIKTGTIHIRHNETNEYLCGIDHDINKFVPIGRVSNDDPMMHPACLLRFKQLPESRLYARQNVTSDNL